MTAALDTPLRGDAVVIVVPVYNSRDSLALLHQRAAAALGDRRWHLVFVDDRSPGAESWPAIRRLAEAHDTVSGIRLLKNRGRASAVFCGLAFAEALDPAAVVIVMDDDLQHDPADIPRLVAALRDDAEVDAVVAQFPKKQHGPVARFGSWIKSRIDRHYYGLPPGIRLSSFVAVDPRVVAALNRTTATIPLFGSQLIKVTGKFAGVECVHGKRYDGVPAYTLAKRLQHLFNILLGDTVLLLQACTRLGMAMALLSLCGGLYFIVQRLFNSSTQVGWTSLFVTFTFFGGINMFLLGLIGASVVRSKENIEKIPAWTAREAVGPAAAKLPRAG